MPDIFNQPSDKNAEISVLGAILNDPEAIFIVESILSPEDFYFAPNKTVFSCMHSLCLNNTPVDYTTLHNELERKNELDNVGNSFYLDQLQTSVPNSSNVESYANIVKRLSRQRKLIAASGRIAQFAYSDDENSLEKAESELVSIAREENGNDIVPLKEILVEYLSSIGGDAPKQYIPTGLIDLDRMLNRRVA